MSYNSQNTTLEKEQTINILQYNLNKRRATTDSVLNHPDSLKYAVLMLQE